MSDGLVIELEQARAEFAKFGRRMGAQARVAARYLATAVASKDDSRGDWNSLFSFWRAMIRGGWRCPACGGEMEYGESSGVRCGSWQCPWVPGMPH
jgi:hypothetical protein